MRHGRELRAILAAADLPAMRVVARAFTTCKTVKHRCQPCRPLYDEPSFSASVRFLAALTRVNPSAVVRVVLTYGVTVSNAPSTVVARGGAVESSG